MTLGLGATLFYMGIIFGKSMRDPNEALITGSQQEVAQRNESKKLEKELSVFDMRQEEKTKLSDLQKDFQSIVTKADSLEKQENPPAEVSQQNKTGSSPPIAKEDKNLKKETPVTKQGPLYTIQVLATSDPKKANSIVKGLKKKDFDAYIVKYQISGNGAYVYRVRVGRLTKDKANRLKKKLMKSVAGISNKLTVIQL